MKTDPFDLDSSEEIPPDCFLMEGNLLMATARAIKAPYRVATRRVSANYPSRPTWTRVATAGIILYKSDKARMLEALDKKANKKKYPTKS